MQLTQRMIGAMLSCWLAVTAFGDDSAAQTIDDILNETWSEQQIEPAPTCSDEQFLRRATLDLAGRIPTAAEREAFLANPDRAAAIDRLLASDEFTRNFADVWTTQLYGYTDDYGDRETLAAWIEEQLRANRPYDEIVETLLTSTGESAFDGPVNFLLRYADDPVVKVSRAFLGVRLDCARCHDHPFDRWTQDDFARMSRFFEAMEVEYLDNGNLRLGDGVREVEEDQGPRFLTGAEPRTTQWRAEFSLFLTRSRPFARNFANRIWYHLNGRGIVHPVDDVNASNPAAIPELLEWLADEAIESEFDIRHMVRLVCNTSAYQAQSASSLGDAERLRLFAVRTVKPLTPEQWYESMCIATGSESSPDVRLEFVRTFYGDALDNDFSSSWEYRETVQGIMSRLVEEVDPPAGGHAELFVQFLGRQPTELELEAFTGHSSREVAFVLLHSSEFAFNH